MIPNNHPDDQIAIYALGALSGQAKYNLEAHLRGCDRCRARLAEARTVVSLLPRSIEPIKPSPEAKRRLLARIDADLAGNARTRPSLAKEIRSRGWLMRLSSARGLAFAVATIIALALVGLVAALFVGQVNQQREIASILANPNSQMRVISGTQDAPTAQAKLIAPPGEKDAVLLVTGLRPLPADKIYEFWLIKGTQPVPAGLFDVDANGSHTMLVESDESISSFDKLAVTIEPRGGEQTPKGTLVLQFGL